MGRLSRNRARRRRRAEHAARTAEWLAAHEEHRCRPGTERRPLSPEELERPLNVNRPPDTLVHRRIELPIGAEWQCECGRRWVLEWDNASRTDRWRELS